MQIKFLLTAVLLFNLLVGAHAQAPDTDSLLLVVNSKASDTAKMRALRLLGDHYAIRDFDKAISISEQGLQLASRSNDVPTLVFFNNIRGLAFYLKGNYDSAAARYSKALELSGKINDPKGKALVLNNAGKLYRKLKDFSKSLSMYDEAFDIYKKAGDEEGLATIYNESGVVYEYKGEYEEAIRRYKSSLAIREKQHDLLGKSYSLSFIGAIYVQQKKYTEAEHYLLEALQMRRGIKDTFAFVLSITDMADMYAAKKDIAKALAYYDSSNAIALSLKYPQLLSENYLKLSTLWENEGNTEKSLAWYKKYASLKDSLLSGEKLAQIEELNTKYQTDKKEQQLKLQRSAIQKKNLLLISGGILVLVLLFAALNIYRRRQAQSKLLLQNEIMKQQDMATKAILEAEENERKRIAAELHDGIGQMMSAAKMNLSVFENELHFDSDQQKLSFENALSLIDESCREIRNVSHQMMPNALLKSSLATAVREFIDKIDHRIIKVTLHAEGLNDPLDKNVETVLYRVIQECVNNVLKHSGANHLDISLIKDADGIAITIEDNGKGFDTNNKEKFEGIGVKNILSRINYLKGSIDFDSSPGKGTLIAIHVPVG